MWRRRHHWLFLLFFIGLAAGAWAQTPIAAPRVSVQVGTAQNPKDVAVTLQVLILMTLLTLAPALLIMTTAFTRIVVVLAFLRTAIGTPTIPPNQVIIGLSLFLTFFVMAPVFNDINQNALQPYLNNRISFQQALANAEKPLRAFMLRQTYEKDLQLFINLSKPKQPPRTPDDVPITTIIPAFILSELKTAFIIGFYIYIPFLIIDLFVASTLMSMGMMMLPPIVISLPFKLLVFIMANGWTLLIGSLAAGFK
jgi:flagellar biosynthetic protein FliP